MNPDIEKPNAESAAPSSYSRTRRSFLRRTGAATLSINLLDLIHPLETFATPDSSCKGYYMNDEDTTCGTQQGAMTDGDGGCGTGAEGAGPNSDKDYDGNCGNSTNSANSMGDKDGSCGYGLGSNQVSPDASCGQITGAEGKEDKDECCDSDQRANPSDTDQNCGATDHDNTCGTGQKAQVGGDNDGSCGWGTPAEADGNCSGLTVGDQDSKNNPDPDPGPVPPNH